MLRYCGVLYLLLLVVLLHSPAIYGAAAGKHEGSIKEISVKEAAKLLKDQKIVIVDVRTPDEFKAAHIPGAVNYNLFGTRFEEQVEKLSLDKPVLVYCRTGNRSAGAADIFKQAGHEVLHMREGLNGWQKAKMPIVKN